MVIIEKYIFRSFAWLFFLSALLLWGLYIIGDVFGFLDEILKERIPFSSLAAFYYYLTPFILTQIVPISALLANVYLLGNLNKNNEITAMRASGISVWGILRPILAATFIISLCVFVINDRILPNAMKKANRIRYEKLDIAKRGRAGTIAVYNVAIYGNENRIIFAKKFDIQKEIFEDIIIHQQDANQDLILKT